MKIFKLILLVIAWISLVAPLAADEAGKLRLELLPIAATIGSEPQFIMTLGGFAYRNVEELKRGIERLPKGAEIIWQPSCLRIGGEPLDTKREIDDLLETCRLHGVKFTILSSG